MDRRAIEEYKLLSYKQALRKAYENDDKNAIKSWTKNIADLKHRIKETI